MPRRQRARQVAYAPQLPVLPDGVSTRDYVILGRTPHRALLSAPRAVDRRVVADVMERLEIGALADRPLRTLSGGEQQRAVLARAREEELPSEGLVPGAVQVPPDGAPVLFLADHPVTGGYPVLAVVTTADLSAAAQLRPGDTVRFRPAR